MYLRITILLLIGAGSMVGASPAQAQPRATTEAVSDSPRHSTFSRLLSRVVGKEGNVDYATLTRQADTTLAPYLQRIAKTDPSTLSRDARLAFWINAYNALTLKLVTEHYPVKNIWAITPGPAAPKDKNSPFKLEVGVVADTARTLDEIEHQIIRRRFDEPRIHFALVCAAVSCPPLRRDAYTGPRLNKQLDNQAHTFLHDNDKNRIPDGEDQIALSRILKWYGSDFGATTNALQRALAPYFDGPVHDRLSQADYEVTFLSYDWSLNRQVAGTTSTTQDAH